MATKRDIKSESTGFQTHGRTKYDLCKRFLIEEVGIRPDQADMCQTTYDLRKRILVEELGSSVIKIMDIRKFVYSSRLGFTARRSRTDQALF